MKKDINNLLLIVVVCAVTVLNQTVFAVNSFNRDNGVYFLGTSTTDCVETDSSSTPSQTKSDNENEKIIAEYLASLEFDGAKNKHLNIVQLAALLGNIGAESTFDPSSNNNDKNFGLAQWSSDRWVNIADPRININNQLDYMKKELNGAYKDKVQEFWDASKTDDLEKATYSIARNYEVAYNPGKKDSSKVWTNSEDAVANIQIWQKRINYAKTANNQYGDVAQASLTTGSKCGGELVSGGMNLSQAESFMEVYKKLPNWSAKEVGPYGLNWTSCTESPLANCVAFSQYFINRYADKKLTNPHAGKDIVGQLIDLTYKDGGHTPKVYAVFSQAATAKNEDGHTGVILGMDVDKGTLVIGEAACYQGMKAIKARPSTISEMSGDNTTYAYTNLTPDSSDLSANNNSSGK